MTEVEPRWKQPRPPKARKPWGKKGRTRRWIVYAQVRSDVENRAKGRCELRTPACVIRGDQCHHLLPRSAGGADSIANCVWVCDPCHRHAHANPAEAYRRGWMVRRTG